MLRSKMWPAVICAGVLASQLQAQGDEGRPPEEAFAPLPSVQLSERGRQTVAASNGFSLDLFRKLATGKGNAILSPASVSIAVGFAYRGAHGTTEQQLRSVMRYPFDPVANLKAGSEILDTLDFTGKGRELHAANAIWTQSGMPFDQAYENDLSLYAKAGFNRIDFKSDPEAARARINSWVGDATRGKIPHLLAPGIITPMTRAALVNALYFKGQWANTFAKEETRPGTFLAIDGSKPQVALMNQRGMFRVARRDGARAIDMPYAGGEISLIAILPDNPKNLPKFETELNAKKLDSWFNALENSPGKDTIVTFPKFSLKHTSDLKKDLSEMGAPIAFSDQADFSGIAQLPFSGGDPDESGLKIGQVIHAATLDVDENGSEAAAATALAMIVVSGLRVGPPPPPPFIFRADKPFLFMLRDNRTGLILFIGHYVKPEPDQPPGSA